MSKSPLYWDLAHLVPEMQDPLDTLRQVLGDSPMSDTQTLRDCLKSLEKAYIGRCRELGDYGTGLVERMGNLPRPYAAADVLAILEDYRVYAKEMGRASNFWFLLHSEVQDAWPEEARELYQPGLQRMSRSWDDVNRMVSFAHTIPPETYAELTKEEPALDAFRDLFQTEQDPHRLTLPQEMIDLQQLYNEYSNKALPADIRHQKAAAFFNALVKPWVTHQKLPSQEYTTHFDLPAGLIETYLEQRLDFIADFKDVLDEHPRRLRPSQREYSWKETTQLVAQTLNGLHPEFGGLAKDAVEYGWMHTHQSQKKGIGYAFKGADVYQDPANHPYIFMDFDGTINSVCVLAHELSHAFGDYLSGESSDDTQTRPLLPHPLNETLAHFLSHVALEEVIAQEPDPYIRTGLRMQMQSKILLALDNYTTVFEHELYHKALRNKAPLTEDQLEHIAERAFEYNPWPRPETDGSALLRIANIPHFYMQMPHYYFNYVLAETAATAMYEHYRTLPEAEKKAFADGLVDIMRVEKPRSFLSAMDELGVEVIKEGKLNLAPALAIVQRMAKANEHERRPLLDFADSYVERLLREAVSDLSGYRSR